MWNGFFTNKKPTIFKFGLLSSFQRPIRPGPRPHWERLLVRPSASSSREGAYRGNRPSCQRDLRTDSTIVCIIVSFSSEILCRSLTDRRGQGRAGQPGDPRDRAPRAAASHRFPHAEEHPAVPAGRVSTGNRGPDRPAATIRCPHFRRSRARRPEGRTRVIFDASFHPRCSTTERSTSISTAPLPTALAHTVLRMAPACRHGART